MTLHLNGFFSLQVLACVISACKMQPFLMKVITGFIDAVMVPPHVCVLMEANDEFFTTSSCQNINIHPRETNRHHLYKRRKGQEVHLFNIYTFSDISHCQGIETMIAQSKRETGRMKDRQAVRQNESQCPSSRCTFICCCLHRAPGCAEAPLTCFRSVSRWVIEIPLELRAARSHRHLQIRPRLNYMHPGRIKCCTG